MKIQFSIIYIILFSISSIWSQKVQIVPYPQEVKMSNGNFTIDKEAKITYLIENTERGRDLTGVSEVKEDEQYCPLTDGASNFRNFITKELFHEIDKRYRVTNKKGIIGESLSGLFVMETFMQKPKLFDFYIAMDPSLWWNDHYLIRNANSLLGNFPNKEIKLWFAGSSAEDISDYTKELANVLKSEAPNELTWKYSDEPNEKHHTIFRATKEKALIWTLNE